MIRRVLAGNTGHSRGWPVAAAAAGPFAASADAAPPAPAAAPLWTPDDAFRFCEACVRTHHENFPVASRFVPSDLRRYVWALYAFARTADDFADEPEYEGRREALLDNWESQLENAFHGRAEHPVFVALRETVEQRDLPILPLRDLLTAFRMDLHTTRYPTWSALRNYMQHSAAPVGQIILYTFGYRDPALHRFADEISVALELTHFIQDLAHDVERGRLYLPLEDLAHFGVPEADLVTRRDDAPTPEVRDLLRFEVARARSLFERGHPLVGKLGRDFGFELGLIWQGGMNILDQIERADYDVFTHRPSLRTRDKAKMVLKSAADRLATLSRSAPWPFRTRR
jgi:squalene synthase HpnC